MTTLQFVETYWSYLTIPAVSGIVGFGTNWLAVKMMLWPVHFTGVGAIGWQGVVPANARKMSHVLVDGSLKKVLPQEELVGRIDSDELVIALNHRLGPFVNHVVDETMRKTPTLGLSLGGFFWNSTPNWLREKVYGRVHQKLPEVIAILVDEFKENLDDIIDVNEVVVERLMINKGRLSEIFMSIANREFVFVARSGLYFGMPLGIPVMVLWYFYPVWWLLPTFGLLIGYITNKIALYMIQKPFEPVKFGPFSFQGLFIKRQKEVSAEYGKLFAKDLVTSENILNAVMRNGKSSDKLLQLVERVVNEEVGKAQGNYRPLVAFSTGTTEYDKIRERICDHIFEELGQPDRRSFEYVDRTLDIEATLTERVGNLPPEEFFNLIHPVVAEDEWKLIMVGAVLGFFAGTLQWALLT